MYTVNREQFLCDYWAYYLMLEEKFVNTLNYVTLSEDNEDTYSNEYAGLIQMIGAEMDSFFKVYCGFAPSEIKNITDYCEFITKYYPEILTQEVRVKAADLTFKPFDRWDKNKAKQSLFWWLAFDNIKHSRTVNRKDASQKNVLYALSALFLLEMKYLRKIAAENEEIDIPDEKSKLFSLVGWKSNYIEASDLVLQAVDNTPVIDGGTV